ncbi:FHA domain-containing protein [Streptomyces aureoverticillatus]|uniref:FHA domain-containing protein n=1 Tax=Streptomyces aureoverticillatus TaxID=66871 RepID=UPI0013DC3418|nr:FHA domain-containing protein [Streptomyces aureoverticillatus]QIB45482.1 FHA domain-containing protein [Streptomyces aureoverticillatus]
MQIRLTVLGPRGGQTEPGGRPAAACDVLVTAPAGTALAAVASGLAASVAAGDGPTVLYAQSDRLDLQRCTLGEPPLVDGAVLSVGTPAEPGPELADAATRLHVVAGPDAGGVHLLHGGQIRVGRSASADVPLDDPDVSRLHCAVTLDPDGRVTVTDLGSTNGTTVDGRTVSARPVRLASGSLLRIGESVLRLTTGAGAEVAPLPSAPDGEGHVRVRVAGASAGAEAGGRVGDVPGPRVGGSGAAERSGGYGGPGAPDGAGTPGGGGGLGTSGAPAAPVQGFQQALGSATQHSYGSADWGSAGGSGVGPDGSGRSGGQGDQGGQGGSGPGGVPQASAAAAVPGAPDAPVGPAAPAAPGASGATPAVRASQAPQEPYSPYASQAPQDSQAQHAPQASHASQAQHAPRDPQDPHAPHSPEAPVVPAQGGVPEQERHRVGTPPRGTAVPRGVRKRGGLSAWARRLAGGRSEETEREHAAYDETYDGPRDVEAYETYEGGRPGAPGEGAGDAGARVPEAWPDAAALLLTALGPGTRLWERDPGHPEALAVRLGTVDRASPDASGLLPAVPVTVSLREAGSLGLAGPRERLAGLARSVLAQLAALHSPAALEIVLISTDRTRTPRERADEWSWLGWLPHVRPGHGQDCRLLLAYDRDQAAARAGELLRRLDEPESGERGFSVGQLDGSAEGVATDGPRTVVVVDGDPGSAGLREAAVRLAREGARAGIHVVCLAETAAASPSSPVTDTYEAACEVSPAFRACGAAALLSGDVATALRVLRTADGRPAGHGTVAVVDAVSAAWAQRFARALAPLRPDAVGGGHARVAAPLPQAARLLDELGLARATPASLMARWAAAADDAQALGGRAWAVLGAGARGPVVVDLVADGPHLLVEGPSGSGRTELLRSVAASLAAAERPDRLGIVLIDGRDGGTGGGAGSGVGGGAGAVAGAGERSGDGLRACTELPHVTTHLAANDPVRMREFAQSLSAELKRRAELLGRVGFAEWHRGREVSGRMVAQRSGVGGGGSAGSAGSAGGVSAGSAGGGSVGSGGRGGVASAGGSSAASAGGRGTASAGGGSVASAGGEGMASTGGGSAASGRGGGTASTGGGSAASVEGGGVVSAGGGGGASGRAGAAPDAGACAGAGGVQGAEGSGRSGGGPADPTSTPTAPPGTELETQTSATLRLRPVGAGRVEPGPALARMVVLVDDFDALLAPALGSPGRPAAGSVVRALEAVARDGERLGVHLVVAARSERAGASEVGRRAGLLVALDAVGAEAEDPAPGRGVLRGVDGRVAAFQGGRVTGRIPRTATLRPTVVPLEWERMGDPPARRPVRELGNGPTDLALLASALDRAARSVSADRVPSLL